MPTVALGRVKTTGDEVLTALLQASERGWLIGGPAVYGEGNRQEISH